MTGLENLLMILLTAAIALFSFLVWKVYERIAWLTGAMESHSELMLRIEACRGIGNERIRLVWWDPTIEEIPVKKQHGQDIDMSTIHIYLPLHMRHHRTTTLDKLKNLFSLP